MPCSAFVKMETLKIDRKLTWAQNAIETVYVHNKSAQSLVPGDTVVLDTTDSTATEIAVAVTTAADDKAVFGMVIENMADNGYGLVQTKGPTSLLKVNGTTDISVGSYISTYASAGIAGIATSGKGGVFAIALEAYATDDSSGVIDAYLMGGAGRFDTAATSALFSSPTFDGSITVTGATAFSSAAIITCAGAASATDALILTLGDILISDGHLDVNEANGTTNVLKIDHGTGAMGDNNASLYIDDGGNIASGGNMLRLVPTGTPDAASILFEIVGAGKIGQAIYIDGDPTGIDLVHIECGGALTNGFACLGITNSGNLGTGGALLNLTAAGTNDKAARIFEIDGTTEDMLGIYVDVDSAEGHMTELHCGGNTKDNKAVLAVTSDGTMVAGSSLVRIESATASGGATVYGLEIACNATNLEGLYVSLGTSLFAEAVTMGTTAKLYFYDTGLYIYASADGKLAIVSDGGGADDITLSGTITTDAVITLGAGITCADQAFADVGNMTFHAGSILASGATNTNTLLLNANDTTFITLTTGATDAMALGAFTASGHITMADAKNIVINTTTGTKIGTGSTQKIGFYNATPAAQPSAYTQTYSTGDKTIANPTCTSMGDLVATSGGWGASSEANFDKITTAVDQIIADDLDLRKAVTSLIDDLQALGLVG